MLLAAAVSVLGLIVAVALVRGKARKPTDLARREAAAPTTPAAETG